MLNFDILIHCVFFHRCAIFLQFICKMPREYSHFPQNTEHGKHSPITRKLSSWCDTGAKEQLFSPAHSFIVAKTSHRCEGSHPKSVCFVMLAKIFLYRILFLPGVNIWILVTSSLPIVIKKTSRILKTTGEVTSLTKWLSQPCCLKRTINSQFSVSRYMLSE